MAMATLPISPTSTSLTLSPLPKFLSPPHHHHQHHNLHLHLHHRKSSAVRAESVEFSTAFFENEDGNLELDEFGSDDDPPPLFPGAPADDKETPPCPPGLRHYETMAILRPEMSEDERLALTQKYEELLVAGGGMYVEVYNRGVIPLSYSIKKKNKDGETNTYFDGIFLLFTYFTKPESMAVLESTLLMDDNVIRSMSFKVRKRKY